MYELKLPALGDGIEKATIACWHVAAGEGISADDDVVEVVTDKASFNVPAGAGGKIYELCAEAGQEVQVGQTLAVIDPA